MKSETKDRGGEMQIWGCRGEKEQENYQKDERKKCVVERERSTEQDAGRERGEKKDR